MVSRPGLTHAWIWVWKELCNNLELQIPGHPHRRGPPRFSPIDQPHLSVPHSTQLGETGQRQPPFPPWSPPAVQQCGAPSAEATRLSSLGPVKEKGLHACSQSMISHLSGLFLGQETCLLWAHRRITHWAQNLIPRKAAFLPTTSPTLPVLRSLPGSGCLIGAH